jgi:alanine-glyoxylate transaminase/serine-glyoxylate transaminase/serine-pyruvate transaminase
LEHAYAWTCNAYAGRICGPLRRWRRLKGSLRRDICTVRCAATRLRSYETLCTCDAVCPVQTSNNMTIAVSGTGHAGMEAAVANVIEPGDIMLVGVNGLWGERVGDLASRYGADVRYVRVPAGEVVTLPQLEAAFAANPGIKVVFLTHGESSTGTLQPIEGVGALCARHGALFMLDTVCTLGGVPLELDAAGVDVVRALEGMCVLSMCVVHRTAQRTRIRSSIRMRAHDMRACGLSHTRAPTQTYSGSQKCLGAPPGAAPFSMSPRARAKLDARKTPVASYYFDANLMGANYGIDGKPRWYHHTSMVRGQAARGSTPTALVLTCSP